MKIEAIFPFPFEHVACSLLPSYEQKKFDKSLKYDIELEYYSIEKLKAMGKEQKSKYHYRPCVVSGTEHIFPFPIKTRRRLVQSISARYDPEKEEIVVVGKTCKPEKYKVVLDGKAHLAKSLDPNQNEKEEKVYFVRDMACLNVRKLDENRTLVKELIVFDACGWSRWKLLQRYIALDRAKRFMKTQLKHLGEPKKLYTFEGQKESLMKDSIGKIIVEIDIPKVRKEYLMKKKETSIEKQQ